jgi:ribosomal protein S18 acetylase RimI-like enzyme
MNIRRMSSGELDEASRLIASAFVDNPNTLAVTRGDRTKAQRIMQAGVRVAKLGRKCSYTMVAEQAGRIVGVLNAAEWPNCQLRIGEKIRTTPAMIKVMGTALPRQLKLLALWGRQDPRRGHWHLGPIGVAPELHGLGIGTAVSAAPADTVADVGARPVRRSGCAAGAVNSGPPGLVHIVESN